MNVKDGMISIIDSMHRQDHNDGSLESVWA